MEYRKDIVSGSTLILMAIFYFVNSFSIRVFSGRGKSIIDSGTMPKVWAICLFLLASVLLVRGLRAMKMVKSAGGIAAKKFKPVEFLMKNYSVIGTFIALTIYILLLNSVGFIIMTVTYLFVQIILMSHPQKRRYKFAALIAVASSLAIYFVFVKAFNIALPGGLLNF